MSYSVVTSQAIRFKKGTLNFSKKRRGTPFSHASPSVQALRVIVVRDGDDSNLLN